jgi:hypothetical protein
VSPPSPTPFGSTATFTAARPEQGASVSPHY